MGDDLEAVAHEAVAKVQALLQGLGDAERECHAATGYVETLTQQLADDRKALDDAVAALDITAESLDVQLGGDAASATAAATVLAHALRQAGVDGPGDLEAEAAGAEHAATLLTELGARVIEMADAAEAASRAALDQATAIAQSLEDSVEKIEHLVGVQFASLVEGVKEQIEEAANALLHLIGETCPAALDKNEGEWREKMGTLNELLASTMEKLEEHSQEVAAHTEDKWSRLLEEEVAENETEAHLAVSGLASLTRLVADKEGELHVASEMVEERLHDGAAASATLEQAYGNVRGRWALLGISGFTR